MPWTSPPRPPAGAVRRRIAARRAAWLLLRLAPGPALRSGRRRTAGRSSPNGSAISGSRFITRCSASGCSPLPFFLPLAVALPPAAALARWRGARRAPGGGCSRSISCSARSTMRSCASSASGSIPPSSGPTAGREMLSDSLFLDCCAPTRAAPSCRSCCCSSRSRAYLSLARAPAAPPRGAADRAVVAGAAARRWCRCARRPMAGGWRPASSACARSSRCRSPSRPTSPPAMRISRAPRRLRPRWPPTIGARWLARSADPNWRFPDPERPYLRVPIGPAAARPGPRWNVIYLQLETLRGIDIGAS